MPDGFCAAGGGFADLQQRAADALAGALKIGSRCTTRSRPIPLIGRLAGAQVSLSLAFLDRLNTVLARQQKNQVFAMAAG